MIYFEEKQVNLFEYHENNAFFVSTTNDVFRAFQHYLELYKDSKLYENKLSNMGFSEKELHWIKSKKKVVSLESKIHRTSKVTRLN